MALSLSQQFSEAIKRSSKPLICLSHKPHIDDIASAHALAATIKKLDKHCEIVHLDESAKSTLAFLNSPHKAKHHLDDIRRYHIELDASKTKVNQLSYEMKEDRLIIHLSPKQGSWKQEDIRFSTSGYVYDLIIAIGVTDYEAFGPLFEQQPDFFYQTPLINIDHRPQNEQYGDINIVELTSTACAEVCFDLIHSIDQHLIDESIATALLTGMIVKTKSFKDVRVSPITLERASKLMSKGAKQEEIIHHLYRTRDISTLRLWGRALARLKVDEKHQIVWSLISKQDFLHAGVEEEGLKDVIDELIATSAHAKLALIFHEHKDGGVHVNLKTTKPHHAQQLLKSFHAKGDHTSAFIHLKDESLVKAEEKILKELRAQLN